MPIYLLQQCLEYAAQRTPNAPALRWQNRVYSYQQLDSAANGLARQLQQQGIQRGDRVAILLDKSVEAVVSIYACLKTGAAYVPLDSRSPVKRLSYIVENCAISGLISCTEKLVWLEQADSFKQFSRARQLVIAVDVGQWLTTEQHYLAPVITDCQSDDLAYILYTSGSTGLPKGVMISHRASLSFVNWAVTYFKIVASDNVASHAPFHFDLSIFDLFASAAAGACVCLLPPAITLFPRSVMRWLIKERVSVWYSAPSALTQLLLHGGLETASLPDLRHILFAGEVFPMKYVKRWQELMPNSAYHNLYGPTETNVCTVYSLPPYVNDDEPLPIGKACADLQVFALTDNLQLAAVDEIGELYVYGTGVMRGYWGDTEKTSAVLQAHPLHPELSASVYRTGDLVKLANDGNYYFIGRRDYQIKSRGYRIELGEIETVLLSHVAINEAVVIAKPDTEVGNVLVAYLVFAPQQRLTAQELMTFLSKTLPSYMIPVEFQVLAVLPKTSTGKINRTLLTEK